jgi:hypothetical protein
MKELTWYSDKVYEASEIVVSVRAYIETFNSAMEQTVSFTLKLNIPTCSESPEQMVFKVPSFDAE